VLRDLHLRNLAVLAEASVELGPGLNVLTGETGAGKSIVVDSLELLGGARASSDLIRTGAEALRVTGVFVPESEGWLSLLAAAAVDAAGEELVVRREISREGRNRVFVNDQPVTLRLLSELAPELLAVHGQREEIGLAAADQQREWLDRAGGEVAERAREAVARWYERYTGLAAKLQRLTGDQRARLERIDLLRFQLREIEAAEPVAGEEDELRQERRVLRHAEAILKGLDAARAHLAEDEGAVTERLELALQQLEDVRDWEPAAAGWAEQLEAAEIQLQEVAMAVSRRLDEVESDPRRLEEVEERLASLERLFRKYGDSSEQLLARVSEVRSELAELEVDEEGRAQLEQEVEEALEGYRKAVLALSEGRGSWGEVLSRRVRRELEELALPKARFAVRRERKRRTDSPLVVDGVPVEIGASGIDQVVFEFSPNPGEELRPLSKVASGGELSRLYLALQLAVRGEGRAATATLVFDEVDAGIGGREGAVLGRKLARLAAGGQLLVVTHLPQVASFADRHYRVRKEVRGGRTFVSVELLGDEERVEEVARMLAGKRVTDLSRSHARELIASAVGEPS
jgi:DNA repair protein RecN (Recombination protein N)